MVRLSGKTGPYLANFAGGGLQTVWERLVTHDELIARIDALGRTHRLIGPVVRSIPECNPPTRYFYQPVQRAAELALDFSYCVYGPKEAVLPPRETLFTFERSAGTFVARPVFDHTPRALVGVHPCDLHALRLLDHVFATDRVDEHYAARRRSLFIVGIDCPHPCTDGVSCADWKTHEIDTGYDVMLTPIASGGGPSAAPQRSFGARFGSDAGRAWLGDAGRAATPEDAALLRDYEQAKSAAFVRRLDVAVDRLPAMLRESYDSAVWSAEAQRCYSCGSCNLVCPTCYCFDVQDDCGLDPRAGDRSRTWDACMLPEFAAVAGGHNFRPEAAQRLRHRVMRKAAWIHQRNQLPGCVGCGRCDRACTAAISLVEILNRVARESGDGVAVES